MSKLFWVDAREWNKNLVTCALESGADAVIIPKGHTDKVKALGLITTISDDGDLIIGRDVVEVTVESKEDEQKALDAPETKHIIVRTKDWKIIPLENLIASRGNIVAAVKNSDEARLALEVMERGADGVLLKTDDLNEIKKTAKLLQESGEALPLVKAVIKSIRQLGMGDRVCIDTCTNMVRGQGMLVGNSSKGMFMVYAENVETPYCATRPFRVNAGAVHAYVRITDGKTSYLADLKTGDDVLIVDYSGNTQRAYVGRSKIERRPLMLVEADYDGKDISLVMQNAETIRLTGPDGNPISITHLCPGDEVLAYVEEAGRHFGIKIEETISEK